MQALLPWAGIGRSETYSLALSSQLGVTDLNVLSPLFCSQHHKAYAGSAVIGISSYGGLGKKKGNKRMKQTKGRTLVMPSRGLGSRERGAKGNILVNLTNITRVKTNRTMCFIVIWLFTENGQKQFACRKPDNKWKYNLE